MGVTDSSSVKIVFDFRRKEDMDCLKTLEIKEEKGSWRRKRRGKKEKKKGERDKKIQKIDEKLIVMRKIGKRECDRV